jgi:hypothetical protein
MDDKVAAVDKVLGEPWLAELGDDALKVRRNLLLASFVGIGATLANIKVAGDTTLFGLHLLNLSDGLIRYGLAVVTGYLFVHFLWCAIDAFAGWRVRVTGTRQSFVTTGSFASQDCDYTGDFRQTSLYNWWKRERTFLTGLADRMPAVERSLAEVTELLQRGEATSPEIHYGGQVMSSLERVRSEVEQLRRTIEASQKATTSPRVEASLKRFDRWFGLWLRSQNLRWLVIDTGAPLVAGAAALFLLLSHP